MSSDDHTPEEGPGKDPDAQQDSIVRAYRQLLAGLSLHLHEPICLVDNRKHVLWSNAAWGRERKVIATPTLDDWVSIELEAGKTDVLFGRTQKPGYLEVYRLGLDGAVLWLLVFMAGETDPLEQRYSEIQSKMLEAQRLESIGVLTARFAHDFSNLLTAILGNADFVAEAMTTGAAGNASSLQAIDSVIAASELSADMCRQLLTYSEQLQGGAAAAADDIGRVELSVLMREMSRMIQVVTSQRADVVMDLHEDEVWVQGNATHLRQLVLNLIINAAEAMRQPGLITVRSGYAELDELTLAATLFADIPIGRYAYLEVVDNGQGMDQDTLARIFDPFYSTKESGRGLGLAAVYSIVQMHRGTLAVTSSLAGSSFKVFLPLGEG